jgi:hypothetical protein
VRQKDLNAHVAALLIAARHLVQAYGDADVREQEEAIGRLRRVVKGVECELATSVEIVDTRALVGAKPEDAAEPAKKAVEFGAGHHRISTGRGRVKRSAHPRW